MTLVCVLTICGGFYIAHTNQQLNVAAENNLDHIGNNTNGLHFQSPITITHTNKYESYHCGTFHLYELILIPAWIRS